MTRPLRYTRYLDTETTGLGPDAEVVELALLDGKGRPLINTLVRPERATRWPDAQRIHGITPAMVAGAPTLAQLELSLLRALVGNHLVVYNLGYDLPLMPKSVQRAPVKFSCAMQDFAAHYGDWNDYHGSFRWQRLTVAAEYVGHTWEGPAHRAAADAQACRSVWRYLCRPEVGEVSEKGVSDE